MRSSRAFRSGPVAGWRDPAAPPAARDADTGITGPTALGSGAGRSPVGSAIGVSVLRRGEGGGFEPSACPAGRSGAAAALRAGRVLLAVLGLLAALVLTTPALVAPALAAVSDPAEMLRDPAQEERSRQIGRELRCLVCQNQSIEDSDAELARDLRRIVRDQVSAGRSDAEVMRFVHDRYGDFVLLRPPVKPETWLLWATPAIALLLGLALISAMRRRRAAAPTALPEALSAAERARLARIETGRGG